MVTIGRPSCPLLGVEFKTADDRNVEKVMRSHLNISQLGVYTEVVIHNKASRKKKHWAKGMRRNPTRGERAFWEIAKKIRRRRGIPFWRQIVLLGWIVDFWCPKLKLVVEIDGESHDDRRDYDERRARIMSEELGAQTIRFSNFDVVNNPLLVEEQLIEIIRKRSAA